MNVQQEEEKAHPQQIQVPYYHFEKTIPKKYRIPTHTIKLTPQQIKHIIASEDNHSDDQEQPILQKSENKLPVKLFSEEQEKEITNYIAQSTEKAVFLKANERTAKDINPFLNKVHNCQELQTVLHTSEYLIEKLEPEEDCYLYLREFNSNIQEHRNHYEVYVKDGVIMAIVQRFHDHIGQIPSSETISKILSAIQVILPGVTIGMSGHQVHGIKKEPNCFIANIFCSEDKIKVLGIHHFIDFQPNNSLLTKQELETFYHQKLLPKITKGHLSQQNAAEQNQEIYEVNENVKPIIKVIEDKNQVKQYDMGEYLMGSQIKDDEALKEWKSFIKEAQGKISK